MLSFETKGAVFSECLSIFSRPVIFEEVRAVKMNRGLCCENFHDTAAQWLGNRGGRLELIAVFVFKYERMVIAKAKNHLCIVIADTLADLAR